MKDYKVLKFLIIFLIAVFVIHQLYSTLYKPIGTETAQYVTAVEGIKASGIAIRKEVVVSSENTAALHFVTSSGTRVAKNGVIAQIYGSASASATVRRIDELTKKIADIEELSNYNSAQAADLSVANNKVKNALNNFVCSFKSGDFDSSDSMAQQLLSAINRKQMITGEQTDFSATVQNMQAELNNLNGQLPAPSGSITAPESGYFISAVDGYENAFSNIGTESITPEFLSSVKETDQGENLIGKIVSDEEWYIAAKVSLNDSMKYKQDDNVTLSTNLNGVIEFPATVKNINISSAGDDAVIIFACSQLNSDLAAVRKGTFTIITAKHSGLKIPKKALRVVKEQTGVYVVSGVSLKFIPVEVVHTMDDYILCKQEKSTENVLRLYDRVVVKGKKLYDGKIIN